ncbi:hypothetical protein M406DRAFT_326438 [Cryphonectria parasitica EP155]|uniref:DUF1275 domain protein n=1 Tax=Cryphonectria parasitica (strain ATCC 38755 / EP155) TaxID=660469 RepID=A0A9P5CWB8_CRYP1|nr:uncharacterized protein M406DRAFT_326438 [Cryphonectria parasitica EP155]KAF3771035.1 hypothetical protein M406DRAFT_326438 [Cryphonectria parasitica EP155]
MTALFPSSLFLSRAYWQADLDFTRTNPNRAQHLPFLLLLSFAAAAVDVFSVPYLGVFTANNTGNIVFLALAAAQLAAVDPADVHPVAAVTSLAASWAGSAVSGQIGNALAARRKRFFVVADILQQAVLVRSNDGSSEYVAVALLSFSMGCQNVTTKGMNGPPTMPTQVATGAMADFFSDPRLLARRNRPRDERILFIVVFFVGGLVGGLAYRYYAPQLCLLLTAVFKLLAGLSLLFLRVGRGAGDEEKEAGGSTDSPAEQVKA